MYFYIPLIIWILLDWFTKQSALVFLQEKIPLLGDILYLQYIENTGIAFSIQLPYLKVLTLVLIIGIFYYYYQYEKKQKNKLLDIAFWCILSGAIWNGIERVLNGYVIDMIGVQHFAVFNLADVFINIWVLMYLYYLWKQQPPAMDTLIVSPKES